MLLPPSCVLCPVGLAAFGTLDLRLPACVPAAVGICLSGLEGGDSTLEAEALAAHALRALWASHREFADAAFN